MMRYNWQNPLWPKFQYSVTEIQNVLYLYAQETSLLVGAIGQLPDVSVTDTLIDLMVLEALKTSEIEGEMLIEEDVRSSIRFNLGLPNSDPTVSDRRASGIAELMLDVRSTFNQPLSKEKLFDWHRMVMGDSHFLNEEVGNWRKNTEPMQIISGPIGRERVYYEAPPPERLESEMDAFIKWFNQTEPKTGEKNLPGPLRAAVAHLYFESIHPFIDGNGRIGRAIAEKALSQDIGTPILFSLSSTIQKNRKQYYNMLHLASGYSLEITEWVAFFVNLIYQSQLESKEQILFVLKKTKFWREHNQELNERQEKVIHRMFLEGSSGFKGGMNAQKYMTLTGCSKATATRDLADLLAKKCFYRLPGAGPNTRYDIVF
ncbi:MAG: Fic family protein [Alphaproteobacteria bacterium]|nr:Fic family protein [Alphaproteobacteria bacterium]